MLLLLSRGSQANLVESNSIELHCRACASTGRGKTEAGRRREARARQTRQRIAAAALQLFLDRGYVATTIEAIANEASVARHRVPASAPNRPFSPRPWTPPSPATAEPVAVLDRDWVTQARRQRNPGEQLRLIVAGPAKSLPGLPRSRRSCAMRQRPSLSVRDLVRERSRTSTTHPDSRGPIARRTPTAWTRPGYGPRRRHLLRPGQQRHIRAACRLLRLDAPGGKTGWSICSNESSSAEQTLVHARACAQTGGGTPRAVRTGRPGPVRRGRACEMVSRWPRMPPTPIRATHSRWWKPSTGDVGSLQRLLTQESGPGQIPTSQLKGRMSGKLHFIGLPAATMLR